MRIIKTTSYSEMSRVAALLVLNKILDNPKMALGLATGFTPRGLYKELIQSQLSLKVDLSQMTFFHLDEYLGMSSDEPESMGIFLKQKLFEPLRISSEKIHFVPAQTETPEQSCLDYERLIQACGGIDLQILGIGTNGHIAFNEPGTPFHKQTHIAQLTEATLRANAKYFKSGQTPTQAMSMGLASIMQAKEIVLLASGQEKAQAIQEMINGPLSESCPASILRFHPNVTLIIDQEVSGELQEQSVFEYQDSIQVFLDNQLIEHSPSKAIVFAPHPDDASLSCGGTLARLKASGYHLDFVSMTTGHRAVIPNTTQIERIAIRQAEAEAESALYQSPCLSLGLGFYEQSYMPSSKDVLVCKRLLEKLQPALVFSASPEDKHPAHAFSAKILLEAVRQMHIETGNSPDIWFYEGPWFLFGRDDFNTVVVLNEAQSDLKQAGICAHESQISRKRYDLAARALETFRAITTPESRLSAFGGDLQELGMFVEVFRQGRYQTLKRV